MPWMPSWATTIEYNYRAGFSRLILGKETSDLLGLPIGSPEACAPT